MSNMQNDSIVSQDLDLDEGDVNDLGIPEVLSQSEIDDLINNAQLSAEHRLARLIAIKDHLAMRAASDFGDDDSTALLGEVERGISTLRTEIDNLADEPEDYERLDTALDVDPLDHRESLAPDDDALLDLEEAEDDEDAEDEEDADVGGADNDDEEDELNAVLDPKEWDADGDGFDSEKGVR